MARPCWTFEYKNRKYRIGQAFLRWDIDRARSHSPRTSRSIQNVCVRGIQTRWNSEDHEHCRIYIQSAFNQCEEGIPKNAYSKQRKRTMKENNLHRLLREKFENHSTGYTPNEEMWSAIETQLPQPDRKRKRAIFFLLPLLLGSMVFFLYRGKDPVSYTHLTLPTILLV